MNAIGKKTAARAATATSHLSCWRSVVSPRRYRIHSAAAAAPNPTTEDADAKPPRNAASGSRPGTANGLSTPEVAVLGPINVESVFAVSAITVSQTTSRQRREIRCPSGKINGIPIRATMIGITKSASPSNEAYADPGHAGSAAAPA